MSASCCAFYSATGIVFTGWVGMMLVKQPFFIGGIEDVDVAKSSAFGASGMFLFTFVVSILVLVRNSGRQEARQRGDARRNLGEGPSEYGQVPSIEGRFVTGEFS
mmetsp:Transcript_21168/g.44250  ORF Transcript_21168/g.44250 Transcript_21168/m.44250 type:complete len:105 (-) Transcript_21168:342-656(-)|eukprot:CAMPEP_0172457604 /NCGR_PEP_ID=MMETSP1065-20121228/23028_1 /TAXON_ID=265537 /ORGANISM="Amphiprora paludosa, Strain CCMP125" /LENGTH=104 /DNA_ID=CAMNT_0013211433 /DNA_START=59 /DNA_END=373 /DNA_ORIENTATION=+